MSETKRPGRTRSIVVAVILLGIVAADTVVWAIACRRLDDGARAAVEAAGWALTTDAGLWRGWPFAAEIVLSNATLRSGPDIIPPLAWTAGTQTLRLSPLNPTRLTVSAAGQQAFALADAPPIRFTARSLIATIDLTQHDPVHLVASDLDIAAPGGPVGIASAQLDTHPDGLALTLATLSLPNSDRQPIQPSIDLLQLTVQVTPPIAPMPTATETARRWRDSGGRLVVDEAALTWGPVAATGKAVVSLDPGLQPALTGQITATGLLEVLDRLVDTGAITSSGAMAARGMLAILSAPTGTGPVSLPIALQNGVVSIARIPLLRLAPIQWD